MNRLKIKYAVAYGFLAATAVALIASLFAGCHVVYEHEEVEIIRCPVIEADTIDIPGGIRKSQPPNFNRCHDEKTVDLAPGHAFDAAACTEAVDRLGRPKNNRPSGVELHLTTEQAATRAMDENCIRDEFPYLYGDTEYHFYFPSVSLAAGVQRPSRQLSGYAIANAGQDLGDKNAFKIQFYETAVDVMVSSDAIPMTDRGTLAVDGAGRCTPSSLRVTRSAAKIAYTIEVADAVTVAPSSLCAVLQSAADDTSPSIRAVFPRRSRRTTMTARRCLSAMNGEPRVQRIFSRTCRAR